MRFLLILFVSVTGLLLAPHRIEAEYLLPYRGSVEQRLKALEGKQQVTPMPQIIYLPSNPQQLPIVPNPQVLPIVQNPQVLPVTPNPQPVPITPNPHPIQIGPNPQNIPLNGGSGPAPLIPLPNAQYQKYSKVVYALWR